MVVSDFLSFHVSPDSGGADPSARLGSKALRPRTRWLPLAKGGDKCPGPPGAAGHRRGSGPARSSRTADRGYRWEFLSAKS